MAGPAGGGKDAVYAGCEIEPTEWSATETGIRFVAKAFSPIRFLLFLFSPVLQFNLWPSQRLLSERELFAGLV
jgi:hypothetical protein